MSKTLAAKVAFLTLTLSTTPAQAATPAQVAAVLQARVWYEDHGSFGNQVFGRAFVFGNKVSKTGWYTGTYVNFKGVGGTITLGFAWKPVTDGVIIDYASSQDGVKFLASNAATEVIAIKGTQVRLTANPRWSSTRSPLTPAKVRSLLYK